LHNEQDMLKVSQGSKILEKFKKCGRNINNLNEPDTYEGWQIAKSKRLTFRMKSRNKSMVEVERIMIDIIYAHQSDVIRTR
jgi:hypothetical protein